MKALLATIFIFSMPAFATEVRPQVIYQKNGCTGFLIEEKSQIYYVTAAHCTHDKEYELSFGYSRGRGFQPKPYGKLKLEHDRFTLDYTRDIAVAPIPKEFTIPKEMKVLRLRPTSISKGEKVSILGYGFTLNKAKGPLAVECKMNDFGTYSASDLGAEIYNIWADIDCSNSKYSLPEFEENMNGFSGGPVLDENGLVVGVTSRAGLGVDKYQHVINIVPLFKNQLTISLGRAKFVQFRDVVVETKSITAGDKEEGMFRTRFDIDLEVGVKYFVCFDVEGSVRAIRIMTSKDDFLHVVDGSTNSVIKVILNGFIDEVDREFAGVWESECSTKAQITL